VEPVFDSREVEPAIEPVPVAEPVAVRPQPVHVASSATRAAAPKPRGNRRLRRAQEMAARKAELRKIRLT
jgi:hypothetical protein